MINTPLDPLPFFQARKGPSLPSSSPTISFEYFWICHRHVTKGTYHSTKTSSLHFRNFQWQMEHHFLEFPEERTTYKQFSDFPETLQGSFHIICPYVESSGFFGWMESAPNACYSLSVLTPAILSNLLNNMSIGNYSMYRCILTKLC